MPGSHPDLPSARATVRDGRVTLHPCSPRMAACGPEQAGTRTVTAALADLWIGDGEVIAAAVPHVPWAVEAEPGLTRWAGLVGFARLWLPDRLVDLTAALPALGRAGADCPGCGAHWHDDGPAFWTMVRLAGAFPGRCLACGGTLPQWELLEHRARPATMPPAPERTAARDA